MLWPDFRYWILFTSSAIEGLDNSKLMIESLLKYESNDDKHVKTIVKPRYVKSISHPHYAALYDGYAQVSENTEYFFGPFLPEASHNIIRTNHYYHRDLEFYRTHKINRLHMRGSEENNQEYVKKRVQEIITNNNNIPSDNKDYSILKYVDKLRDAVGLNSQSH